MSRLAREFPEAFEHLDPQDQNEVMRDLASAGGSISKGVGSGGPPAVDTSEGSVEADSPPPPDASDPSRPSGDLVHRPSEIVVPGTGEIVTWDAPSLTLGQAIQAIRDEESRHREMKRHISAELLARMDKHAKWTLHCEGMDIKGESPDRKEYDPEKLEEVLTELVKEERISAEAAKEALAVERKLKPRAKGLNALKKLGLADVIEECQVPVTRDRRISISVKR